MEEGSKMDKPNVIICLCDQLRAFESGCYGNNVVQTPHIDRLACEGVRFELAVTNAPVCVAARSCLLAGQYSRTCTGEVENVADDPPAEKRIRLKDPCLAEFFKAEGYHTALIGKWHIHPSPLLLGFDYALYPSILHRYAKQWFRENNGPWFAVDKFTPEFEIQKVSDYITAHRSSSFFLFYNISLPHGPIGSREMPEKYLKMYERHVVPLRANVFKEDKMAHDKHWFKTYTIWDYFWRRSGGDLWDHDVPGYPEKKGELNSDMLPAGFDLRDLAALYYGAVSWVDDLVGRLIVILEENGILDNTIVVFTSDHGDNLGSHHLFNKDCLFEESIRIPLIFHWPKGLRPSVNPKQIAQLIDIMPTLLDICEMKLPEHVQGKTLVPVLEQKREVLDENFAFIETPPFFFGKPCIGIRTPRYLYGMKLADGWRAIEDEHFCFFDLRSDPYQQRDLTATGEQPEAAQTLREQLRRWNAETPWSEVIAG